MKAFIKISMYVLLPEIINEPLSFFNGPSTVNLEDIAPIPPFTLKRLLLPSFILTSRTDDIRPP